MRALILAATLSLIGPLGGALAQEEEPVAPYVQSDAKAGASPIIDPDVLAAFNGREGIARIANRTIDLALADPHLGPIFQPFDMVRLRRTLNEHFCYLLGGGCTYTGRDMATSHADMGVQTRDFNLLVRHLRTAMSEEGRVVRDAEPLPRGARADAQGHCRIGRPPSPTPPRLSGSVGLVLTHRRDFPRAQRARLCKSPNSRLLMR